MSFSDAMTLGDARDELRTLVDEGHRCPLCTQFAKVYKRTIHSTMAVELIRFYRAAGREPFDLPSLTTKRSGDPAKLRYWGLLRALDGERDDGSDRVGIWQVTELGERFVLGRASVPKYARVYDGRCLGLHGKPVTIRECLGERFDYRELMAA